MESCFYTAAGALGFSSECIYFMAVITVAFPAIVTFMWHER